MAALSLEELDALVEEADTLANYLMDEGFDLVNDLGCIVGMDCCRKWKMIVYV